MPRPYPLSLCVLVIIVLALVVPSAAAEPELVCGDIPFGQTPEAVLKAYEGSVIRKEETPYIESIGNYALEKYFEGGLKKDDSGICFLPRIVQKYTVTHKAWKSCDSMTLYFGAFNEERSRYTLFMVKRTRPKPPEDADFKEIFSKLAGDMDKSTGAPRTTDQGRVQSFTEQTHTYYFPALVGTWEASDTLVFVMTANSPEGPLPPEEIFVSKPALKKYLEICKTY